MDDICSVKQISNLNSSVLAVGTRKAVHVILLHPNGDIKYIAKSEKPYGVEAEYPPVFHLMRPLDKSYVFLVIFWRNKYVLMKNDGNYLMIVGKKDLDFIPVWSAGLSNQLILTIDEEATVRVETIEGMFLTVEKKKTLSDLNAQDLGYSAFGGHTSRMTDFNPVSEKRRVHYYGREKLKDKRNEPHMWALGKAKVSNWKKEMAEAVQKPTTIDEEDIFKSSDG